jgi:dTDP-4-dehydrorhamnose 3,5-epimerase
VGAEIRELAVAGSFVLTPKQFPDDRGVFLESYRFEGLADAIGHRFVVAQSNLSRSKRGVVRGIHYADVPPSQAKYVTCVSGAVMDFVIDIRVGSPTFGVWDAVQLDDVDHRAAYISEGMGHCFVALSDDATVTYLVSQVFDLGREHGITPTDPEIALEFPQRAGELLLSTKDLEAPTLAQALEAGSLPQYADVVAYQASLSAD